MDCKAGFVAFLLLACQPAFGQQETIYSSVLNAPKPQPAAADDPLVCLCCARAGENPLSGQKRTFVAVLLHRGTAVGKNAGTFGVFVRSGDTTWTKVTLSNTISFGLGYYEHGPTRRYYLAGGNGVHRSSDGGNSWRTLTGWRTEEILCVVPDPVDSAVIYAATPFGVFKTTDDGSTWSKKAKGFKKWFIQRIIMDRGDRKTLYAASEDDMYRSTDAGEHWSPLHVGGPEILALLQPPGRPEVILAGQEDDGVKYSTDRGASWKSARMPFATSIYTFGASADGSDLYAAGWKSGLWRSEDGGASWSQVWRADSVEAFYSICVEPEDRSHVMVGTVGSGVFESLDRSRTWRGIGLSGAQVKQIELYP